MSLPHEDLDSILRFAALAWARGGAGKCADFMKKSAATAKKKIENERQPGDNEFPGDQSGLAERYRWLRRTVEARRNQAAVEAILAVGGEIRSQQKGARTEAPVAHKQQMNDMPGCGVESRLKLRRVRHSFQLSNTFSRQLLKPSIAVAEWKYGP